MTNDIRRTRVPVLALTSKPALYEHGEARVYARECHTVSLGVARWCGRSDTDESSRTYRSRTSDTAPYSTCATVNVAWYYRSNQLMIRLYDRGMTRVLGKDSTVERTFSSATCFHDNLFDLLDKLAGSVLKAIGKYKLDWLIEFVKKY